MMKTQTHKEGVSLRRPHITIPFTRNLQKWQIYREKVGLVVP